MQDGRLNTGIFHMYIYIYTPGPYIYIYMYIHIQIFNLSSKINKRKKYVPLMPSLCILSGGLVKGWFAVAFRASPSKTSRPYFRGCRLLPKHHAHCENLADSSPDLEEGTEPRHPARHSAKTRATTPEQRHRQHGRKKLCEYSPL